MAKELGRNSYGLVYFKPAGVVLQRDALLQKLLSSPVSLLFSRQIEVEFNDNVPIPTLKVITSVSASVNFQFENGDALLSPQARSASTEVFDEAGVSQLTLDGLASAVSTTEDAASAEPEPPVKRGRPARKAAEPDELAVINFPIVAALAIGEGEHREPLNNSPTLDSLKADLVGGAPLRSAKDFIKLGEYVTKYAGATSDILRAEQAVIASPGFPAATIAVEGVPAPAYPMPAITAEQLDDKRKRRQKYLGRIQKWIQQSCRIDWLVPVTQLDDSPAGLQIVTALDALLPNVEIDRLISQQVEALFNSVIVELG